MKNCNTISSKSVFYVLVMLGPASGDLIPTYILLVPSISPSVPYARPYGISKEPETPVADADETQISYYKLVQRGSSATFSWTHFSLRIDSLCFDVRRGTRGSLDSLISLILRSAASTTASKHIKLLATRCGIGRDLTVQNWYFRKLLCMLGF